VKPRSKNNYFSLFFIVFVTVLSISFLGCASNDETIIMRQDILRMDGEITRLKSEVKEVKKQSEGVSEEKYADLQTQIDTITSELKALNAKTDDILQRINETDQEIARLKREIQSQNERIAEIEKKAASPKKERRVVPISSDITGASSPVETMYDDAYLSFTKGNFQEAREKFRAFLRKYPKTAYGDNAQFWIGETYYSEGDFESAILEYEKVIRNYR
jgi:TolA-binding protein